MAFVPSDNIAVIFGYIRQNFHKKCWIDDIIRKIVRFYPSKSGSLYVFGDGKHGRLGIETYKDKICYAPTVCVSFDKLNVLDVSVGRRHTLILDIDNNVWSCGKGKHGQLGTGENENLYIPTKLDLTTRIISVSAGDSHSLLLCENGNVMSFGVNSHGQLGHGNLAKSFVPKTIVELKKYEIVQICADNCHSAALTGDGDLFCFGNNAFGQCGIGSSKRKKIKLPKKVAIDDEIAFVECGYTHTLLITCRNLVYSFGNGKCWQLGHGDIVSKDAPTLVKGLKHRKIEICAAGLEHSLCIDNHGILWSFGKNTNGQCGASPGANCRGPTKMNWFNTNHIKVKYCVAAGVTSCAITEDGSFYSFGNKITSGSGTIGKLPFFQSTPVKKISLGRSHIAIIS